MFHAKQDYWEKEEAQAWFENQDRFKDLIIDRYRNSVQGRLANVRRGKNLSELGIYRQQIELDAGVTMEYTSLWGREYVTLTFAEWLVKRLLQKLMKEEANQCMLVLYGEDRIMAFYMSDVYEGKFNNPCYKARMKTPWEDVEPKPYPTVQELLDDDKLFTRSAFDISNKMKCPKHDAKWMLVNYWGVRSIAPDGAIYYYYANYWDLIFNGSGDDVYTLGDKYRYSTNDKTLEHVGAAETRQDETPTAVDKDGQIGFSHSEGELDSEGIGTTSYIHKIMHTDVGTGKVEINQPVVIEKVAMEVVELQTFSIPSQRIEYKDGRAGGTDACPSGYPPTIVTDSWPSKHKKYKNYFDGELLSESGWRQDGTTKGQDYWISTTVDTYGGHILSVNFGTEIQWNWRQASGGTVTTYRAGTGEPPAATSENFPLGWNTAIWNDAPNPMNTYTTDLDIEVYAGGGAWWVAAHSDAFCGAYHISRSVSSTVIPGLDIPVYKAYSDGDKSVSPFYFPYAVGGKIWASVGENDVYHLQTPYEDIPAGDRNVNLQGWLNLHNGAVLVQGAVLSTDDAETILLYIDGERRTTLGGVDVTEMRTIFIDIPLRLIKRWATKPD